MSLGTVDYQVGLGLQERLWAARVRDEIGDSLLLLEHPPVLTLGRRGERRNLLVSEDELARLGIKVYQVERGGDITYHGPGQLIGYPIFRLKNGLLGVRQFVENVEQALIIALSQFGIKAGIRQKMIGVWAGEHKIASIGIAVRNGVTLHGFALNFGPDLSGFQLINPCGLKPELMTAIAIELKRPVIREEVEGAVLNGFEQVFNIKFQRNLPRILTTLTNLASSVCIRCASFRQ
ncbi:MAG: lipoyl(octanoyl) transferase LipB [candidate division WOR-3 bacterium]